MMHSANRRLIAWPLTRVVLASVALYRMMRPTPAIASAVASRKPSIRRVSSVIPVLMRPCFMIVARASRYVVDLNRGPSDFDGAAVEGGGAAPLPRGLVWRLTTEGEPILARRLPRAELTRRMETVYEPYHHAVRALLHDKRERFGFAILLCAHSMPSQGRRGHQDAGTVRVDVVPGSRGRTSAASSVIDAVERVATKHALTLKHDDPYKGGFATAHYGRPAEGFHAIQIELARRLYMDEDHLGLDPEGLPRMQRFADDVVATLGALDAGPLRP